MALVEDRTADQAAAAAGRFADRAPERARRIALLSEPGGIARADDPDRIAARLDRLSRLWAGEAAPVTPADAPQAPPSDVTSDAMARGLAEGAAAIDTAGADGASGSVGAVLEKIVNTADFVGINYLEAGVAAARAVGRVNIGDGNGRLAGYGTGSLVSPRLLLTNHHVLPDADTARVSEVEFDYQDGVDGQPRQSHRVALAADDFFLADEERDFALVAVAASGSELAPYGFNRLIEAEGKAIVGDFVTIVQHPSGRLKQIALRDNRIVDIADAFLHYEADTEPGSSGSPVFNDQWEIVALHHASVAAPDRTELGGFMNEGIRISRILRFVGDQQLADSQRELASQIVEAERIVVPVGAEAIEIDSDYTSRAGYDPNFLGVGDRSVPLPELSPASAAKAAVNSQPVAGDPPYLLRYHHFGVVLSKERKLAFFTAVNIDGALGRRLKRERDRWSLDPRVPAEEQTGEAVYSANALDRGHLVRRLDPAWGATEAVAKTANDDTFHFTNCTPQHEDFNQSKTTWAGLEDYILENADNQDFKVSVFTGPVFSPSDEEYRGVKLPRQYWKVVVMVKAPGELSATAYLLSQKSLLSNLEAAPAEFSYGAYKTFQVPVAKVEELTGISFGALCDRDPLAVGQETAAATPTPVDRTEDLVL